MVIFTLVMAARSGSAIVLQNDKEVELSAVYIATWERSLSFSQL